MLEANEENWESVLASKPLVFVGFFAPWCGHCKKLKPHWAELAAHFAAQGDELAEETSGLEPLAVASVDVVANPELYWRYDIKSYPTLRLFRRGVQLVDCDEARDADALIHWAQEHQRVASKVPIVRGMTQKELGQACKLLRT